MGFISKVIPDKSKEIYRQYGLDTSLLGTMQKSEVFVIDALGEIAFAQGHGSPLRLPKVSDVFDVVKSLNARHIEQK
jgi:peroxiredoxin